jgi:hypothetical protein
VGSKEQEASGGVESLLLTAYRTLLTAHYADRPLSSETFPISNA